MHKRLICLTVAWLGGCGSTVNAPKTVVTSGESSLALATSAPDRPEVRAASDLWVGAAAEGSVLSSSTTETFLGVWVDVPSAPPSRRPPMEVALVIDVSGSMAGAKIENARSAARMLIARLKDGDIVALDTFSDHAHTLVPPTVLDANSRATILSQIGRLQPQGATNIFEGLGLAEGQVQAAPASHPLRRVVLVSDGNATVGPSSPEILGALAERGVAFRAQVTALGVGTDYDERTLDALAVRSSGRMFHIGDPEQLASVLDAEMKTLDATIASDAQLEIVPAPGVSIVSAEGNRAELRDGALRIPLGSLHAGQHREALVKVRIQDPAAFGEGETRSLASVRLRFRDAQENDLERIQETVARTRLSRDGAAVAKAQNSRTQAIVALADAAKTQLSAASAVSKQDFRAADESLAKAEERLSRQAEAAAPAEKKRLEAAAGRVATARKGAVAAAKAPAPAAAARSQSLEINANAMHDSGF